MRGGLSRRGGQTGESDKSAGGIAGRTAPSLSQVPNARSGGPAGREAPAPVPFRHGRGAEESMRRSILPNKPLLAVIGFATVLSLCAGAALTTGLPNPDVPCDNCIPLTRQCEELIIP